MSVNNSDVVRTLAGQAAAVDGVAPLSGHVLAGLAGGELDAELRYDQSGHAVAAAVFPGEDPAELLVTPSSRGQGIGTAVVTDALDRAGAVWAHGDLPAAAAVAARLGLVRGRELLQLRWRTDGEPIGPAAIDDGITIRSFRPDHDEDAVLAVNARAFAWHPEQGRLDRAGLAAEMAQDWFDAAGFFVAVDDRPDIEPGGQIVGFHWTKVHPVDPTPGAGPAGPVGEVYVLAVDPQTSVRGIGGALTRIGLEHLVGAGLTTVMLYVEGDNDRALALYRRFGFSVHSTDVVYRRPGP